MGSWLAAGAGWKRRAENVIVALMILMFASFLLQIGVALTSSIARSAGRTR